MDLCFVSKHEAAVVSYDHPELKQYVKRIREKMDVILRHEVKYLSTDKHGIQGIKVLLEELLKYMKHCTKELTKLETLTISGKDDPQYKQNREEILKLIYIENDRILIRKNAIILELKSHRKFAKAIELFEKSNRKFDTISDLVKNYHPHFDGDKFLTDLKATMRAVGQAITEIEELKLEELIDEAALTSLARKAEPVPDSNR